MTRDYLSAQRKAIYSILVDQQFGMMLDYKRQYFTDPVLGNIIDAIHGVIARGGVPRPEAVIDYLRSGKLAERTKQITISATDSIAKSKDRYTSGLTFYLAEKYREHVAHELISKLGDPSITDAGRQEAIRKASDDIMAGGSGDDVVGFGQLLDEYYEGLESGSLTKARMKALRITKSRPLCQMFHEYVMPFPYCVMAQPGFGKTRIISALFNEAQLQDKTPLLYTFEDSSETSAMKCLASMYQINARELVMGGVAPETIGELKSRTYKKQWNGLICQKQMDIREWALHARRSIMSHSPDIILIDFIQAFSYDRRPGSERDELVAITRTIREISKEFLIPIVYASQVNERNEDPKTGEVQLNIGHAKGSGTIEQDVRALYAIDGWRNGRKRWKALKYTWDALYGGEVDMDGPSGRLMGYEEKAQ